MKASFVLVALSALTVSANVEPALPETLSATDLAIPFHLPLSALLSPRNQAVAPLGVQYRPQTTCTTRCDPPLCWGGFGGIPRTCTPGQCTTTCY